MKTIDLVGTKSHKLTVIHFSKNKAGRKYWMCKCDCGNFIELNTSKIRLGIQISCGCEKGGWKNKTHGLRFTNEYTIWSDMKTRCYNTKCHVYKYYGALGIKVCDRWLNSFENFLVDMGNRPSKSHSLDRFPNKNGNYEPENLRWATDKQQACNRSSNKYIEYKGETKTHSEWNDTFKRGHSYLYSLLKTNSFEEIYKKNQHRISTI
jgi:hypothetical protein